MLLRRRTLGILGYGGIGRALGSMVSALGMKVMACSRSPDRAMGVETFQGRDGLLEVLGKSDAVTIALPLSRRTAGLVGSKQLETMKEDGILVNVARAEIVDEEAIYKHLMSHPGFTYATDVWKIKDGKETYSSRFPFLKLPNFIGTPHIAGGSAAVSGEPGKAAADNLVRHLRGERPQNLVDPSEYL